MRLTDFWERMEAHFGAVYAHSWAKDTILKDLGGRTDVKRLGDRAWNVVGIRDEIRMLRDRHRDALDVGFLEGIGTDRGGRHLAGDGDHRNAVHVRIGNRRHQVRCTRTGGRDARADPIAGECVSLCGMPGALLMPAEDVPDLR